MRQLPDWQGAPAAIVVFGSRNTATREAAGSAAAAAIVSGIRRGECMSWAARRRAVPVTSASATALLVRARPATDLVADAHLL